MGAGTVEGCHIFLSAGEASGDLHGAALVKAIRSRRPDLELTCLGGDLLRSAGARVLVDNRETAVVGLSEVFEHARKLYDAWKTITAFLVEKKPRLLVLIDFPDFNFLLGRFARRHGIKVFYYISPQVWAWRSGRVRSLKKFVDSMAVILPFEKDFYAERGMSVHYVGHPLLDILDGVESREDAVVRYFPGGVKGPVVGLLPGSRSGEIRSLLPIMLGAARRIFVSFPHASFLLPIARSIDPRKVLGEISRFAHVVREQFQVSDKILSRGDGAGSGGIGSSASRRSWEDSEDKYGEMVCRVGDLTVRLVQNDSHGVMKACDLLLAASGTVTLEAAILNVPLIIVYKVSPLSAVMGRHLIRVSHVGLPNLIAGKSIAPELLQEDAREEVLADRAMAFLKNPGLLEQQRKELGRIKDMLGQPGVAGRVAGLIEQVL